MAFGEWRRWGLLIAGGALVVLLLARLDAMDESFRERRAASAVFVPAKSVALRDDNLADEMAALSEGMRLLRVRWDHGILSVDVAASAPADLWLDAKTLIAFAFMDKNNVGQLLIRYYNGNNEERTLLSSLETRRADWTRDQLERLRPTDLEPGASASERVRTTVTGAGERWMRNFSNS